MTTINRDGSITVDATGLRPAIRRVTPHHARGAVTVSIGLDLLGSEPPEPRAELMHLSANRLQLRKMAQDLVEQLDAAEGEVLRLANLPQVGQHGGVR